MWAPQSSLSVRPTMAGLRAKMDGRKESRHKRVFPIAKMNGCKASETYFEFDLYACYGFVELHELRFYFDGGLSARRACVSFELISRNSI